MQKIKQNDMVLQVEFEDEHDPNALCNAKKWAWLWEWTGESFYRHLMNSNSRPLHTNIHSHTQEKCSRITIIQYKPHIRLVQSFASKWCNTT